MVEKLTRLTENIIKIYKMEQRIRQLERYTRIYMVEMRLSSLSYDPIALEEFKKALEEDFRWKKGLTDRWGIWFEYFWVRTKPVEYFGVYQIRYLILSNKEWIEPKGVVTWNDLADGNYNSELLAVFKKFIDSDKIDKNVWGYKKKLIRF